MQIRFLQTTESENQEYPFMAGQVIDVPAPSPSMQMALRNGSAELVKAEDERAVAPSGETPEFRDFSETVTSVLHGSEVVVVKKRRRRHAQ